MSRWWAGAASVLCLALTSAMTPVAHAATTSAPEDRYALANGCFVMRSAGDGSLLAKRDGAYRASAARLGDAEPFFAKAADLGSYLLYDSSGEFLAPGRDGRAEVASEPRPAAVWRVEEAGDGGFTVVSADAGRALAGGPYRFEPASGCRAFPEIELSAEGEPFEGKTRYGEVRGFWDPHMHIMAFEAFGGGVHCGRPWHPLGVAEALPDCARTEGPQGATAPTENFLNWGAPVFPHDTRGWPTFRDWPNHHSLTYEQTYYRWLERAWMGGLRIAVNLFVDNRAFCEILAQPQHRRNPCNEMNTVRLEHRAIHEMQDYIDAQAGGPGEGFFRIVRNPFEARRVINQGKLAVVLGIEISELFGCILSNEVPQCDRADVDRALDEWHRLGVRDMELLNKFDNAFTGVRFDGDTFGLFVNTGQQHTTGRFWEARTCTGPEHDNTIATNIPASDPIFDTPLDELLPFGRVPVYPNPPHCNVLGLLPLGEYLVQEMMERKMIIDPDHMSVLGVNRTLDLAREAGYSGVVSSHTWMDTKNWPDIYDLGGVVGPAAGGGAESFVESWELVRDARTPRHYFGMGFGDDMNGFAGQGAPRTGASNPVRYPFESFDGGVTLDRQRSGERVFDINVDGVAHFGMYPDFIEDLRMVAGNDIVRDLSRGAEAYLQMWERAEGIPPRKCRAARGELRRRGLGRVRLKASPKRLLKRAGQPHRRPGRTYRYCLRDGRRSAELVAVFGRRRERVALVTTNARRQGAAGIAPGDGAGRLRERAESLGGGLWRRDAGRGSSFVYRVGKGKVRLAGVASDSVASSKKKLRGHLRQARSG